MFDDEIEDEDDFPEVTCGPDDREVVSGDRWCRRRNRRHHRWDTNRQGNYFRRVN